MLVAPAAAEGGKGGVGYEYTVSNFDYDATGDLLVARGSDNCEAGRTADWIGQVESVFVGGDLQGGGNLVIHPRGAAGFLRMQTGVESNFGPAEHTVVTECCPPGGTLSCDEGQQTDSSTTQCTDGPKTTTVAARADIRGGVGDKVKLDWRLRQVGVAGEWVPDIFSCVEPFDFESGACKSRATLSSFTRKKFSLPFRCMVQKYTPPPGDYDQYAAGSTATGSVQLTRTKRN